MPPTPDSLFALANLAAMAGWVLLILAPRRTLTRRLVLDGLLPLTLAAAYVSLMGWHYLGDQAGQGGFSSLPEVAALFRDPWALLAGWVHYLCFDLSVGIWESKDARRRGVPHFLLVPILLFTFLFGPLGFLLYVLLRRWYPMPLTNLAS